mmetsp:Transcript_63055/g.150252  ORF Transcript_63055/g.150252 Transcript_63055/m.150252 type:complete len:86 (-) Transcript_63055:169-426(-)
MVRIVNGEIETSDGTGKTLVKKSVLDQIAGFFWDMMRVISIFIQTIVFPRSTTGGKFADGGSRPVGRINPGGSSNTMVRPPGGGG